MNEAQTPSDVLTSDLHGGRGIKLTDGFYTEHQWQADVRAPARHAQQNAQDAR